MGHVATVDADRTYALLQQRLDRQVTGAPDSPTFQRILRLLFTEDEADLAAHIPSLVSLPALAAKVGSTVEALAPRLDAMAGKGLVVDLEVKGKRYVSLAPVVIGFYEFTFMRTRDDAPMEELAHLFGHYFDEGDLPRSIFAGSTQIGRSLVREEALPESPPTEVLAYERASEIIGSATSVAVSLCPCRHHARLAGHGCDAPLRTCLSLNGGADALVRAGLAEPVSTEEGLAILAEAKAAGLAQTADNVKHEVSYICNCCGCCCGMMTSIKKHGLTHAIVSSNWIAHIDHERCTGCGKCVKACPVGALHLEDSHGQGPRRNWAVLDTDACLGCGVCHETCEKDAHEMLPRERRVFTPEGTFDRIVAMAIERGKLGDLLVDQLDGVGGHALARVLSAIEHTPPARRLATIEPLKSTFLRLMVAALN